jgi:2,3-bisphosphoglycerate-dependent phosphoglycerate mutase
MILKADNFKFDASLTSCLTRANQTLELTLKNLDQTNIPVKRVWQLNERLNIYDFNPINIDLLNR